jgi:phage tail tape-measure protein
MADQQLNITLNAIDNTKKALTDLQNNLKGIDKQAKEATTTFFTFSNVLKTYISAEVIRGTFNILSAFQDMKVALNQVTGSVEQGSRAFNFLNKFSETSRFNIKDLSNAFVLLYRAGINPSEELLKTFTDTASATIQPLETLNALVTLFTKGTEGGMGLLQFKRLEGEGILVFKILREQFGLSKKICRRIFTKH